MVRTLARIVRARSAVLRFPIKGRKLMTASYYMGGVTVVDFTDLDNGGGTLVAIVNRSLASRLWPGERAIGRRLRLDDPALRIVDCDQPDGHRRGRPAAPGPPPDGDLRPEGHRGPLVRL